MSLATINAPEISPLKVEGGWREGGIHDKLLIEFKPLLLGGWRKN
jgi:hypothetical protein